MESHFFRGIIAAGFMLIVAALMTGCASIHTFVVLLPEEGGAPTAVTVGEGDRAAILDKPFSAAKVDTKGNIEKTTATQEDVNRSFGAALAAQPPKPVSFTLYFDSNSTEVAPNSRAALESVLKEVGKRQAVEVQVTGHTDRVGNVADNDRLSLQRAEAVRATLIKRGIAATFIRAVGRGEREPLIPTADEQFEARNRRVEIIVR
jgi:OOP family OmpA-OmpF porin